MNLKEIQAAQAAQAACEAIKAPRANLEALVRIFISCRPALDTAIRQKIASLGLGAVVIWRSDENWFYDGGREWGGACRHCKRTGGN